MKTGRCLLVVLSIAVIGWPAGPAQAKTDVLSVAGVALRLGMTLEEVRTRFQPTRYELRQIPGARESYALVASGGPPFESPGNLTFRNGKLWWIGKNWGNYFGPDAVSIFNALYGVVSAEEKTVEASVDARAHREPGVVRHVIRIRLSDGRTLSISLTDREKTAENVSILENLGGK